MESYFSFPIFEQLKYGLEGEMIMSALGLRKEVKDETI